MDVSTSLQQTVQRLPLRPGVYQFYDAHGRLLYIGKAMRLRSRVQSYFRPSAPLSGAKLRMVGQVQRVEVIVVDTSAEALLLETTLIKKYKPPYNVVMKDDKNFQFIHITNDLFPRIETVRKLPLSHRSGRYYGPYTSGIAVQRTLHLLKSIFYYCDTPPVEKRSKIIVPKRPCLAYHFGRCIGPCAGVVSSREYRQMMGHIERFLRGEYNPIRRRVEQDMRLAAQRKQFERAARLRDALRSIDALMVQQKVVSTTTLNADYLSLARVEDVAAVNLFVVRGGKLIHQEVFFLQHTIEQSDWDIVHAFKDQYYASATYRPRFIYCSIESRRGKHRQLLAMGVDNAAMALEQQRAIQHQQSVVATSALQELANAIGIHHPLRRIEIYDISNVQGKYSVGSMVVYINGQPVPQEYRKFNIKTVDGPDDFASIREIMNRRVRHLNKRSFRYHGKLHGDVWPRPDLIIIDGGKGQLSAAHAVLAATHCTIPIVSLAKQQEELFLPGRFAPVCLPNGLPAYHLVQRMRDEAHRVAIGFYRRRHLKGFLHYIKS